MKKFESLNQSKFAALDNKAMVGVVGGREDGNGSNDYAIGTCTQDNCDDADIYLDDKYDHTIYGKSDC